MSKAAKRRRDSDAPPEPRRKRRKPNPSTPDIFLPLALFPKPREDEILLRIRHILKEESLANGDLPDDLTKKAIYKMLKQHFPGLRRGKELVYPLVVREVLAYNQEAAADEGDEKCAIIKEEPFSAWEAFEGEPLECDPALLESWGTRVGVQKCASLYWRIGALVKARVAGANRVAAAGCKETATFLREGLCKCLRDAVDSAERVAGELSAPAPVQQAARDAATALLKMQKQIRWKREIVLPPKPTLDGTHIPPALRAALAARSEQHAREVSNEHQARRSRSGAQRLAAKVAE